MKATDTWRNFKTSISLVFSRPGILAVSIIWSWIITGVVLWLPNIELITAVFAQNDISFWQKSSSLLELYQLVFNFFGVIQLVLVMLFSVLIVFSSGLFFYILRAASQQKLKPEETNLSLLASVGSAGVYMTGLIILAPVVTVDGLVFGYRLHGIGLLLAVAGALGLVMSAFSLMRLVSFRT